MSHLAFECGARLPELKRSFMEHAKAMGMKPRKKDGRFALTVLNTSSSAQRPQMPNGTAAPCFWCPKKRASGRKEYKCWPEDYTGEGKVEFYTVITCYPEEVGDDD